MEATLGPRLAPGPLVLEVTLDGVPVEGSPFETEVASNYGFVSQFETVAYGPGLDGAVVLTDASFTVELRTDDSAKYPFSRDVRSAGDGPCVPGESVSTFVQALVDDVVVQPAAGNGRVVDNCDGTYEVTYLVSESGEHVVQVLV